MSFLQLGLQPLHLQLQGLDVHFGGGGHGGQRGLELGHSLAQLLSLERLKFDLCHLRFQLALQVLLSLVGLVEFSQTLIALFLDRQQMGLNIFEIAPQPFHVAGLLGQTGVLLLQLLQLLLTGGQLGHQSAGPIAGLFELGLEFDHPVEHFLNLLALTFKLGTLVLESLLQFQHLHLEMVHLRTKPGILSLRRFQIAPELLFDFGAGLAGQLELDGQQFGFAGLGFLVVGFQIGSGQVELQRQFFVLQLELFATFLGRDGLLGLLLGLFQLSLGFQPFFLGLGSLDLQEIQAFLGIPKLIAQLLEFTRSRHLSGAFLPGLLLQAKLLEFGDGLKMDQFELFHLALANGPAFLLLNGLGSQLIGFALQP